MDTRDQERGAALMMAIMLVVILSMLATVSLNLAAQEVEEATAAKEDAIVRHLAEAGADLVMQWFHDPATAPADKAAALLAKRYDGPDSGPSFFDAEGRSQFTGTADKPDLLLDARDPSDNRLLNDPASGWFRTLSPIGQVQMLRLYGPSRPGLLCTIDVTAGTNRMARTVSVQFGANHIPAVRAAIEIGNDGAPSDPVASMPVWVHWGDVMVKGDVHLGLSQDMPRRSSVAPVTGQSYAEMDQREDRWLNVRVGGEAELTSSQTGSVSIPSNVYSHQDPVPGLQQDQWDYLAMKKRALSEGTYYLRGDDGLLYRNGHIESGLGQTLDAVIRSETVGDHHGLVFVDTLDQTPPRKDNLGTLVIEVDYAEGLFVINANVLFKPHGTGQSVPMLSPPTEDASLGSRVPVELNGISLRGVLMTPGDLVFAGNPRIVGAVMVGGRVKNPSEPGNHLEIWYDYDLGKGLFRGIPLVYVALGTWQERY